MIPVVIIMLLLSGSFFSRKSYDFLTVNIGGVYKDPHPDIMLILIDENSIVYGEKVFSLGRWPWNRSIYSEILNYIHLTERPKAVFFDILFSEASDSTALGTKDVMSDSVFQQSIYEAENVYHNIVFSYDDERKEINPLPADMKSKFSVNVQDPKKIRYKRVRMNDFTIPIPCLRVAQPCEHESSEELETVEAIARGMSVASFKPDPDGLHRQGHILFDYQNSFFPSVSLAAVQAYFSNEEGSPDVRVIAGQKLQVGDVDIPLDKSGNYLINYYKNRVIKNSYSMSALFESANKIQQGEDTNLKLHPDQFKDKIIIIGCSAVGCQDLKSTPVDARMPGPEIHATLISNILQGNHIKNTPVLLHYFLVLFFILIPVSVILFSRFQYVKIGLPVLLSLLIGGVSIALFHYFNFLLPFLSYIVIGFVSVGFSFGYQSIIEGKEKRKYSKILGNLVDPQIVKEALNDLESLRAGSEALITPFFSDIAGFTSISEKLLPVELGALLNEYLSEMTIILKEHQGTLDKYIGDAIVGIFGAPLPVENHPLKAAQASLAMMQKIVTLRAKWKQEQLYCPEVYDMHFRIGLNTGMAKVGFMGTKELASYTMMGDTVNLAARLESAAKDYGVSLLISDTTYQVIKSQMFTRLLDYVRVKGKETGVKIYELISAKGEEDKKIAQATAAYEEGFSQYLHRSWKAAMSALAESQNIRETEDKATQLLIERCRWYQKNPPEKDWNGVFVRTHK